MRYTWCMSCQSCRWGPALERRQSTSCPQQDPIAYDQLVKQAEAFIQMRFLPSLHSLRVHPIVHIVKVLTQALSQVSCSLIDAPANTYHPLRHNVRAHHF